MMLLITTGWAVITITSPQAGITRPANLEQAKGRIIDVREILLDDIGPGEEGSFILDNKSGIDNKNSLYLETSPDQSKYNSFKLNSTFHETTGRDNDETSSVRLIRS